MAAESFLKYTISFLVDKPDAIQIREIAGEENVTVEIRVAQEDLGKVIGRNGRIAKSLRTLVSTIGAKEGKNYSLEIID
ncbi:MAG TPA: KH domain-containing protein [Leptospiraceae bacterium]|nr:KH domain-containing protein [Leptospiraceae bacterium]HMY69147.1 KH domain-containing protein [Leptospiraceae bacterium]HMZ57543.1 KH domain-containing protein [Leptospiraceae bacterium]HNF15192.1 KH domain-containing protein [Leptospiraceae bacterium]HNF27064.1 KH domain-containing protein [Leptospiraceae bacterium]